MYDSLWLAHIGSIVCDSPLRNEVNHNIPVAAASYVTGPPTKSMEDDSWILVADGEWLREENDGHQSIDKSSLNKNNGQYQFRLRLKYMLFKHNDS